MFQGGAGGPSGLYNLWVKERDPGEKYLGQLDFAREYFNGQSINLIGYNRVNVLPQNFISSNLYRLQWKSYKHKTKYNA